MLLISLCSLCYTVLRCSYYLYQRHQSILEHVKCSQHYQLVVAYFRRENVLHYTKELIKLSDLNVALKRIKVGYYSFCMHFVNTELFQDLLCIKDLSMLTSSMLFCMLMNS